MASQRPSLLQSIGKLHRVLLLDRREIGAIYVFAVLAGLVQLSLPLGIQSIINFTMAGSLSTSVVVLIVLVLSGVFVNGLLQVRQLQIIEKLRQKLYVRYSLEFSERLPQLNMEKLDHVYLPETVNRHFESVSLQKGLDKLLVDLPAAAIQVLLGLILLAFYHPVFIAFGLVLIGVVLSIIIITSQKGLQTAVKASSYKYAVVAWLQEIARSLKTFKYTKGTFLHMRRTDELLSGYLRTRTSYFTILNRQFWSLVSFKTLITAAMLIIGTFLLVDQQINIGQFIAADIVIIAIIGSIEKIITHLDSVYDAMVSIEKLSDVTSASTEESGSFEFPASSNGVAVQFKDVQFAYHDQPPVLRNVNIEVQPGQMVLICGPSGSGKSSLLRLLTGAFVQYEGSITLDGLPLKNYSISSLRGRTGILLGSQDIFQGTLWENLTMGLAIAPVQVNELVALTGLNRFLAQCPNGYDTYLEPVGNKLPAAVRKNILLVRALLGNNRLLLLEEPFEHLVEPYRINVIRYLADKKETTVLIASKDEALSDYCDQIIRLETPGMA